MSAQHAQRKPRKDCRYDAQERNAIEPFKELYQSQTTRDGRLLILKSQILPAMFNYWVSVNKDPQDQEERVKRAQELAKWLTNNWRPHYPLTGKKPVLAVKRSEVLWKTKPDLVFREIAALLGIEKADTSTPDWFGKRLPAIQNILERMTDEEKAELDAEVQQINNKGYPEEIKRRLADKHLQKRTREFEKQLWNEMGAVSLTFTAYTAPDGKLVIDMHEQIANLMGTKTRSFAESYTDETSQMKRLLLQYVKLLRTVIEPQQHQGELSTPATATAFTSAPTVTLTDDGFPLLPSPFPKEYSKEELENICRSYLGQHYKLATKGRSTHVPYQAISEDPMDFVDSVYVPSGISLARPRNMSKADLSRFLQHLVDRQEEHGPHNMFRFHQVKARDKILPSQYPDCANADADADADAVGPSQKSRRRTKKVQKPKQVRFHPVIVQNQGGQTNAGAGPSTSALNTNIPPGCIVVGQAEMDTISENTEERITAINGPADGPPQYAIPLTLYREVFGPIDPTLLTENELLKRAKKIYHSSRNTAVATDAAVAGQGSDVASTVDSPVRRQRHKRRRQSADQLAIKEARSALRSKRRKQ